MRQLVSKVLSVLKTTMKQHNIPSSSQDLWIKYGLSTFNKTRYSSHTNFLQNCLRNRHIPKGFHIKFHTGNSIHLNNINSSAIDRCSFQLIRNTLRENQGKLSSLTQKRNDLKQQLQNTSSNTTWRSLSTVVHELNSELYDGCKNKKEKKNPTSMY